MWSDWTSLTVHPQEVSSVLDKLPSAESKKIVTSVVNSLLSSSSSLETEQEVSWCLEVLQYGLTVEPCESLIQDCVNIYCQWLSVLLPSTTTQAIPNPISQDANHFARKMLNHLYLLFKRVDSDQLEENDSSSLLVTLCVQVLRLIENIGQHSSAIERESWHCLLSVLLASSDLILGQPGSGGHLCYTVVSVLVHTWLAACAKCFPEPTMWKTLITLISGWRHRLELVSHWSKVNLALLSKQLVFMYGPQFPSLVLDSCCSNLQLVMSPECVAQTSFRFLHMLGNICELSQPKLISKSQPFLQAALRSPVVIDPQSHPCLNILPDIFLKAMCGVSKMVDAYLGCNRDAVTLQFSPLRSRCNSILNLFGPWLFQAALLGTKFDVFTQDPSNSSDLAEKFYEGRAEALGTLCIIFSAKKFCEDIETPYIARFFMAVQHGLGACSLLSSRALQYSGSLMILDLPGANTLLPHIVTALKSVLLKENTKQAVTKLPPSHLRMCSIEVTKTVAAIPTHFSGMVLTQLQKKGANTVTVDSLRTDIFNFLVSALQDESDPENCQQILGTLAFVVELQAAVELDGDDQFKSETDSVRNWITSVERLVCHRLISSWTTDYRTSLSAIELLAVLAESSAEQDGMECKRVLRWICDFIVLQCNRPPPAHSRDMHSSIIAAFQTCLSWLVHRPTLLEDKDCLASVLEVAELAISGSKSQGKASDTPIAKEDKKLNPVSKRVRCAAEDLISAVMQKVGYIPGSSLSEKVSTQLNEELLAEKTGSDFKDPWYSPTEGFKYFLVDKSSIVAISKESLPIAEKTAPTAVVLFRGAFGKTAWMMQLRNTPIGRLSGGKVVPDRPVGQASKKSDYTAPPCNFPPVDVKQNCAADTAIATLGDFTEELEGLNGIITKQEEKEDSLIIPVITSFSKMENSSEPTPCSNYQTSRLILSQLGMFSLPRLEDERSSLIELETSNPGFWEDLKSLDRLGTRTHDTVLVFYVKNRQKTANDILSNSLSADLPPSYLNLLSSLGWQVEVEEHSGWTGNAKTSWNVPKSCKSCDADPSISLGKSHILYWSDEFTELAILVPCEPYLWSETGLGSELFADNVTNSSNLGSPRLGLGSVLQNKRGERLKDDQRVVVCWMENLEDADKFPLSQLVPGYSSVCLLIFLQPLASGLVRVKTTGWDGKPKCVVPLVDGLVVSPLVVGQLVRQTALNMCRRARLESDCFHHTPSTRRRAAVQMFGEKFGTKDEDISKMLESLFK